MTKLQESAKEYVNCEYWSNKKRLFEATDPLMQKSFLAGARWLLEEANKIALQSTNETTSKRLPDMRAMELVRKLEELCEEPKES